MVPEGQRLPETRQASVPLIHRVVQADGRRFSLKFEQPFWTILEEEAGRQELSVARLVQRVAQGTSGDASLTAALRLYCLDVLRERTKEIPSAAAGADEAGAFLRSEEQALRRVVGFFATVPAAGLLLNRQEQVVCVNRAFEEWSRVRGDHLVGKSVHWHFQLRMPEPAATVLQRFADGAPQTLAARVSYISPGRIVVANARVSLVLWNAPEDFFWAIMIETARPSRPQGDLAATAQRTPG